jgi:serine/threonine protein kinase
MTFLTTRLQNISIGQPFAIGQRADILYGYLEDESGKYVKVAVKVLRAVPYDDHAARQELRQSLETHLNTWCALKHPNVTEFLGLSYDVPFPAAIILPYYSKGNSLDFVKREENADVLKLIQGAAKGIKYLHEQSPPIIHADIRACNVLVDDGGNARLVDQGLLAVLNNTTFTTTNVVGPARWQAPEVFLTEEEDRLPFTLKTDVFSFSMFAVELLTKDRPFGHLGKDPEVIRDITRGLRPHKPKSYLGDKLWHYLEQCWAEAPGDRPDISTVCQAIST